MRNKNYIIGGLVALGAIIVIMVLVIIFWGRGGEGSSETDQNNPFGDTGDTRTASSTGAFDPFGNPSDEWLTGNSSTGEAVAPLFRAITNKPSLGVLALTIKRGGSEADYVRFGDRTTGHLLETPLAAVLSPSALSKKAVLRTGEVLFSPDGESTMLRYLDESGETIHTYLGSFNTASSSSEEEGLHGRVLPNNIISADFSLDGRSAFYIVPTETGSVGYVESVESGTRTQVWSSPLRNITTQWLSVDTILVYTNPSTKAQGFVWLVKPSSGRVEVLLGEQYALAAKPDPQGKRVLYSMHEALDGVPTLRVLTLATGEILRMPSATLVEKCSWGPVGSDYIYCGVPRNLSEKNYLDKWYQGLLLSDDVIWRFNVETGEAKQIIDPYEETKTIFDVAELSVGESEDYLAFRNLSNSWIWAVQLPKEEEFQATTTGEILEGSE